MHELAVCQSIIKQVSEIAAENHANLIEKIFIQVGPLSGVEPELLQAAFPMAKANTVARHAQLFIDTLPLRVRCEACKSESDVSLNNLTCRVCGNWNTRLLSGDELLLRRVELNREH